MRMAKCALAVLALLLPSTAWSQANFNIPPDWQHNQQNGMQIFRAGMSRSMLKLEGRRCSP